MTMGFEPAAAPRDLLLCLSHLRWNFVLQRPQHLLVRAAKHFQVIFFEEPEFTEGVEPDLRLQRHDGVLIATPVMSPQECDPDRVIKAQLERLVAPFQNGRSVIWYYTPMAVPFARDIEADCTIYDCMDELSAFRHAPKQLRGLEQELLASCDLVFTGGDSLYEAKRQHHPQTHCFPSSIDAAHFARARRDGEDPADQADIPHPRIGFFGVVDERLDIDLLKALATQRPDWHFVMIGPVVKIDPAELPQGPNIHWLGRKTYAELPDYLRGWDAGFMPFAINDSTRFISPTKTPEFLAAGLPVVSTPIRDVVRNYGDAGLVEIAASPADMAAAIANLLLDPDPAWLEAVDRQLGRSSWDKTWGRMHALIETILQPAQTTTPMARELERSSHV